jgi:membrane-bound lytic murein transglycosylase D
MEAHPKLSSVKIALMMVPLLFSMSCVSDISFLKFQERSSPESNIVEGSEENLSTPQSEERTLDPEEPEREKTPAFAAKFEEENIVAPLPVIQDKHTDSPAPKATKAQTSLTPTKIDQAMNNDTSFKREKEGPVSVSATSEGEQSVTSPPDIQLEHQTAALPKTDKDKIIPNSLKSKEEKPVLSADIEREQQPAVSPKTKKETVIPAIESLETRHHKTVSKELEEMEQITLPVKSKEERVARVPAEIEQEQKVAPLGKMEEADTISDLTRIEQKEPGSLYTEKDGEQEIATIPMFKDQALVYGTDTEEKEKPIHRSIEIQVDKKIAATPQGKEDQTLPFPGISEEEAILTPAEIENPLPPIGEIQQKSDQELLDSALEFCQASYDFWEQGDLYNALDALDQAYSLILKVNPEEDPELLQQKEDLRFTISKRIIEVYSSRFTVANGRNSVIPLVMNGHVERALTLFKGRERKFFLDAYRRSGKYRPAILKALKEAALPEELSWLPLIESGFKVRALSRSRALGLWQFIASTGYKFGLQRDTWVDERMDPEKSTAAAIAYLKELHQIFGDWTTALAAYNCGEGKVLKCIRTQRINYLDNFWDLYERLPSETAFYVPKLMAVLHILNDPKAHGFMLPPVEEEIETEAVTIDKQVHMETIAEQLDVSHSLLRNINPALRYNYTPNRPYSLKVPKGKGAVLLSRLDDMPVFKPPVSAYSIHKVRKGESLSVIARRYRTSVRAIMNFNGLRNSHYIRSGWKLKIPTKRIYASRKKFSTLASSSQMRRELTAYVVQKGDSLWRIADRFGTTTKAIQAVNRLYDTRLRIGQELLIPQDLTTGEQIKTKIYIVSKGDSPYLIAKKYHMELSYLLRINNLSPRSTIFPGQVLHVKEE